MPRTSNRRWKGCQCCRPHKNAANGDADRAPWAVKRQLGVKRRMSRHDV